MAKALERRIPSPARDRMLAVLRAVAIIALLSSMSSVAEADGVMMPRVVGQSSGIVASPKQEALLICDQYKIEVVLRTHFRAGPRDLAWIIPVPQRPESIEQEEDAIFEILESETAPTFSYLERSGGIPFACDANGPTPVAPGTGVSVVQTGTAGIFDYTVLEARETDALTDWLTEHEYAIPDGSRPVFQRYVDDGWYWLAIRLGAEHADEPTLAPHPIRYAYHDSRLIYPLVISQLSADERNEIVLYIVADQPYGCENWKTLQFKSDQLALDDTSASGTNYEELFLEMIQEERGHAFVMEFASDMELQRHRPLGKAIADVVPQSRRSPEIWPYYFTRLRTVVSESAMDRDVFLVPTRVGRYNYVSNEHRVPAPDEGGGGLGFVATAIFLGALILAYIVFRRSVKRRRRW